MEDSHWIVLVPYYFFTALCLILLLLIGVRIARIRVSLSTLATIAVVTALCAVVLPPATGLLDLHRYRGIHIVVLLAASFVLAAVDAVLARALSSPLDEELADL